MLKFPKKKYSIIKADCPWWYNNRRKIRKDTKKPTCGIGSCLYYPLMKTKEICALPVKTIAADNSILFLWTTMPHLFPDAMQVIEAWGFKYITMGFVWIKINTKGHKAFKILKKRFGDLNKNNFADFMLIIMDMMRFFGVGTYSKSNVELCLMASRGKIKNLVTSNKISQIIFTKRFDEHSRKPDEIINQKIDEMFSSGKRIELFARRKYKNWDSWGNEV